MSEVQLQAQNYEDLEQDLGALWGQVISQVAGDGPNKAVYN